MAMHSRLKLRSALVTQHSFRFLWLLTFTLLVAAFLRLWQIGTLPPGLHYDEAADTIIAEQIARGESAPIFVEAYTGKEVLFFYWAAAWMKLIGPSAFAMRLAAAMMGVLTVAVTYWMAREMFHPHLSPLSLPGREGGGKGVALLATIFIATSFWHVLMSRVGFRSIGEPLVQALALAALFRGLRLNRRVWFVIAGAMLGLNLYTYLAARLFPVAIAVVFSYLIVFDRRHHRPRLAQLAVVAVAAAVVFAPLGIYFLQHPAAFLTRIQQVAPHADQAAALLDNIGRALGMFFLNGDPYIRFNQPGRPLFPLWLGVLFIVGAAVAAAGVFRGRTLLRRAAYFSLIALTLVMLLPTALAVNEITPSNLRAIGLMPLVFVFPALGAWWLIRLIGARRHAAYADRKWIRGLLRSAPLIFASLAATALDASTAYFGQYVNDPQLYVQSDGDLAAIANVLNHTDTNQDVVYIAALHYRHPTVAALANHYGEYKWLTGSRVVVLPNRPAYLFFARLALPDEAWLSHFLPDAALLNAPLAPDGQTDYRVYHLAAQPVITPQIQLDVNFGNLIQLMGYDRDVVATDRDHMSITLYWRVLNKPDRGDYSTFAQLRDEWGFEWGQSGAFDYPSEEWEPGEIIVNRLDVPVAGGAPPGDYELRVGVFSQSANQRLNIVAGDGSFGGTVVRLAPLPFEGASTVNAAPLNIGTRLDREARPGLQLLGYSLETTTVKQGAPFFLTLFWQSTAQLKDAPLTLQLAACGCGRQPKTTTILTTTLPVHGTYPFSRWQPGETVADRYRLRAPLDLTSGDYTLEVVVGNDQPITLGSLSLYQGDRMLAEPTVDWRVGTTLADAIELVGYNLDQVDGATHLTLIWHALRPIDHDYTVFVHVLDGDGQQIGGQDNQPLNGTYPTSWWVPGEYVIDPYTLKDSGAGLEVGLYDPETGVHLGPSIRLR